MHSKLYESISRPASSSSSHSGAHARKKVRHNRNTVDSLHRKDAYRLSRVFFSHVTITVGQPGSASHPDVRVFSVPTALLRKHTTLNLPDCAIEDSDSPSPIPNRSLRVTGPAFRTTTPAAFQNFLDFMYSSIYDLNKHASDYHPFRSHITAYVLGKQLGAKTYVNAAVRAICHFIKPRQKISQDHRYPTPYMKCEGILQAPFTAADVKFALDRGFKGGRLRFIINDAVAAWTTADEIYAFRAKGAFPMQSFSAYPRAAALPSAQTIPSSSPGSTMRTRAAFVRDRLAWNSWVSLHRSRDYNDLGVRLRDSLRAPVERRGELFRDPEDYVQDKGGFLEDQGYFGPLGGEAAASTSAAKNRPNTDDTNQEDKRKGKGKAKTTAEVDSDSDADIITDENVPSGRTQPPESAPPTDPPTTTMTPRRSTRIRMFSTRSRNTRASPSPPPPSREPSSSPELPSSPPEAATATSASTATGDDGSGSSPARRVPLGDVTESVAAAASESGMSGYDAGDEL